MRITDHLKRAKLDLIIQNLVAGAPAGGIRMLNTV